MDLMVDREGASSLNYLIETPFQTRTVELLINNVEVSESASLSVNRTDSCSAICHRQIRGANTCLQLLQVVVEAVSVCPSVCHTPGLLNALSNCRTLIGSQRSIENLLLTVLPSEL